MLRSLPMTVPSNVLLGLGDDASVVRVNNEMAIVQTVDYISPVVNDPFQFGRIAAANALSDIYAMGALPSFALNIAGFPLNTLPIGYLQEILRGGAEMLAQVGVPIVGGHTYEDHAPKYGLTVTGYVHPEKYVTKQGCQEDDVLILTKPLGVGIITTAIDQGLASQDAVDMAVKVMTTLNDKASQIMMSVGVNACTDVTGFGLLGHLYEMLQGNNLYAEIQMSRIPVLEDAWSLIKQASSLSNGTKNNMQMVSSDVEWGAGINVDQKWMLCDAQTSGGLLISVAQAKSEKLVDELVQANCLAAKIGRLRKKFAHEKSLIVTE